MNRIMLFAILMNESTTSPDSDIDTGNSSNLYLIKTCNLFNINLQIIKLFEFFICMLDNTLPEITVEKEKHLSLLFRF